ncbi:MAG: hypothetical protein ACHQU1_09665, partial [Gemmatimonadales bacterium]
EGTVQYGMQSFDQSLMRWYTLGDITLETALFYCTNPTEFALNVQGIAGSSDRSFEGFQDKAETAPGGGKAKPTGSAATRAATPAAPGAPAKGGAGGPAKGGDVGISRDPFQT